LTNSWSAWYWRGVSRPFDAQPVRVEDARLGATDLEPVEVLEQRLLGWRHAVDEARFSCLGCRDVDGVTDHVLGQVAVASVAFGQRADVGGGVVADLVTEDLVVVASANRNGRGGTDVCLRRHCGHVTGLRDEEAGRRRPSAVR
jgi:hypothetical protein